MFSSRSRASVALAAVLLLGALQSQSQAGWWTQSTLDQCPTPTLLPRPPAGPWVQSIQVCGPVSLVIEDGGELPVPGFGGCQQCVTIVIPWGSVHTSSAAVRLVVDGSPMFVPVFFPTQDASIPQICLYSNNPFSPYPNCLLVV